MLRSVRDASAFVGMMIYVISIASLFKVVGDNEDEPR